MWNLKYDTIEPIYETETYSQRDIENRLVIAIGRKGWSGRLGLADEIYLYIEWIKNEVLQYGTGNFIQYLGINHNGKEYICRAESICCTAEMNYTSIIFLFLFFFSFHT